jgi:signal transduction histidine kinase
MLRRLGASLRQTEGCTPSPGRLSPATLGRALAIGLPAAALVAGLGGVLIGIGEPTLTGVSLEPPGGRVISVDPASFAWAEGIRPGQLVLGETGAADPDGWAIETMDSDGTERRVSRGASAATVRLGLLPALVAIGLALVGLASATHRRRRAEWAGVVALEFAWVPFAAIHDLVLSPFVGTIACLAPSIWLLRWTGARAGALVAVALSTCLVVVWLFSRVLGTPALGDISALEFDWSLLACAVVLAVGFGLTPSAIAHRSAALRYIDVAGAIIGALGLTAVQLLLAPPPWVPVLLAIALAVAFRRIRNAARGWIDRVVFAEQRERAAIEAAESERARLSRELHDDPLQAIAGVILRLEDQPDTDRERETLRTVANQLRNIATKLHPPVLDDLGLVPAVESLFADPGPVKVELQLESAAGYRPSDRPPFEVELAAYRIIQEAATNAIRHSGCRQIIVRGQVGPLAISVDVVDDGRGIRERDLETALRHGHFGLASMRGRAEAIDARLTHLPGSEAGTVVSLRWSA